MVIWRFSITFVVSYLVPRLATFPLRPRANEKRPPSVLSLNTELAVETKAANDRIGLQEANCAASNGDLERCAGEKTCFPHYRCQADKSCQTTCLQAQIVQCKLGEQGSKKLMLFLSDGLSENDLKNAFRQLVLQLPSDAWRPHPGSVSTPRQAPLDMRSLAGKQFQEPSLYTGLKALVISDACFFKRFETDGWPCEDFKTSLVEMGFDSDSVNSVYLTDLILEGKNDKSKIEQKLNRLNVASGPEIIDVETPAELISYAENFDASSLLEGVDVVAVNGGNPDYVTFVMTRLAPHLTDAIRKRVVDGSLIYMGRSAGAMVGGKDVGLTTEPAPSLTDSLLGCRKGLDCENNLQAMGFVGICSIRPHYSKAWDVASEIYERVEGINVVRIPNGEGMMCARGVCKMVGWAHKVVHGSDKHKPPVYETLEDVVPHHEGAEADLSQRRFCIDCTEDDEARGDRSGTPSFSFISWQSAALCGVCSLLW